MAGYSGTPLVKKLGIKPGMRFCILDAPAEFEAQRLEGLPDDVDISHRMRSGNADLILLFVDRAARLRERIPVMREAIVPNGAIWIAWPKKASRVNTDITENTVREVALPLGLVDNKVCAIDEVWSGLRLVIRRELRTSRD